MNYRSKIKMSIGWIYPIGILTAYILAIIEWALRSYLKTAGHEVGQMSYFTFWLVGLFFFILGIMQWYRYRNWIYPVLGLLVGVATLQASLAIPRHSDLLRFTYFLNIIVFALFVILNWRSLYSQERFEINSRRLFRLAAERLYETSDGFTERPYSAGKIVSTKDELLGFVRFLHGNYIVRPFYLEDTINIAFSMNTSLMVIHDPSEVSQVILGNDGSVVVKIAGKDYRDYRERLSFDQLCASMASVFIRFMDYYQKGLESRIFSELKSAR
jgi:hypothetical protein